MLTTIDGIGAEEEANMPCQDAAANLADLAGDKHPAMPLDLEGWRSSKRVGNGGYQFCGERFAPIYECKILRVVNEFVPPLFSVPRELVPSPGDGSMGTQHSRCRPQRGGLLGNQ
jgi:hypothetical protein